MCVIIKTKAIFEPEAPDSENCFEFQFDSVLQHLLSTNNLFFCTSIPLTVCMSQSKNQIHVFLFSHFCLFICRINQLTRSFHLFSFSEDTAFEAGVRVQIHSQVEPPFVHELGFGVAPGFQTFVATQEQRVGVPDFH